MNVPEGEENTSQWVRRQRTELQELGEAIDTVVTALETPWQWHGDMRRKRAVVAKGAIAG
jgi:hypothetical protein